MRKAKKTVPKSTFYFEFFALTKRISQPLISTATFVPERTFELTKEPQNQAEYPSSAEYTGG